MLVGGEVDKQVCAGVVVQCVHAVDMQGMQG
jgi:hypothetical protein